MSLGVWRLVGGFPRAQAPQRLNQASRSFTSSCAACLFASQPRQIHRRHFKGNHGVESGPPKDHEGRSLSYEAQAVAREYWRLQRKLQSLPSPPPPALLHELLHEIYLHRAAYNHVVLDLSGTPEKEVITTYEPPYVGVSSQAFRPSSQVFRPSSQAFRPPRPQSSDPEVPRSNVWQISPNEQLPSLSEEQERLVQLAEDGENIFFTGSAGTGKSIVLKAIVQRLKVSGKTVQVAAPTGKAAFNVNNLTTWSYAGWSPGLRHQSMADLVFKSKYSDAARNRIQDTHVLIIDEISMVENHHFERLNTVHKRLREDDSPFGGVQVIVVGDFCQLPPVLPFELCYHCGSKMNKDHYGGKKKRTTYSCVPCQVSYTDEDKWAFRSKAWKECNFTNVHLNQIHRQSDPVFKDILQKCRVGARLTDHDIETLVNHPSTASNVTTKLFPTRHEARLVNEFEFFKLKGEPRVFKCIDIVHNLQPKLGYLAERDPDGTLKALREQVLEPKLYLKIGMPVILSQNLDVRRGLVNGSQGTVIGFKGVPYASEYADRVLDTYADPENPEVLAILEDEFLSRLDRIECPEVEFENGARKVIRPITRIVEYGSFYRKGTSTLLEVHTALSRTQLPLCPAWAMTIHKSQGMTMDNVIVDLSRAFAMGQSYVALSRARSLSGLTVEGDPQILRNGMGLDQAVKDFMNETFGDEWLGGVSVSETSSVSSPMRQAVDETELVPAEAEAGSAS